MSGMKHTLSVVGAIVLAYIWLSIPSLFQYSLQAFAVATFGFFIVKRASKAQIWHILPKAHSFEIVFVSFATVLLVGATGNTDSLFYPFAYIHLFFLVMTSRQSTAIAATIITMLVHYALEPNMTTSNVATVLTLPLMLTFFLFARRQYDDARLQLKIAQAEEKEIDSLSQQEQSLETFITSFLSPKLSLLQDILETAIHRNEPIDGQVLYTQVSLLASESQKVITQLHTAKNTEIASTQDTKAGEKTNTEL